MNPSILLFLAVLLCACNANKRSSEGQGTEIECMKEKIAFNLDELDEKGMMGPADGKVTVDYEFCIPRTDKDLVLAIDPEMRINEGKGRVGCGDDQYLCIGNTGRSDHREVLCKLSALEQVTRIERTMWE